MKPIAAAVALVTLLAQSPQTPATVIDQIDRLLQQLRTLLASQPSSLPAVPITTAAQLTAALAQGGAITLAPGTYTGNFTITKPTVLTGAGQASTLLAPLDPLTPPLTVAANDVTVQDLAVRNGAVDRETVVVGSLTATSTDVQPHRVLLRRITVTAPNGGHRGLSLHGADITVDACTVTGFWEVGRDSQAIWINNGPGPYTVTNCTLEASGENLLVGGDDPKIPNVIPADLTIRGNTIRKPADYRTHPGSVKNLLELKNAQRVLIEGNVLDGNWRDAQSGNAIVLTVRNQGGKCPWCQVDDVIVRGNTVTNALDGFAVNILGADDSQPSAQTHRITIERNLFRDSPAGVQVINGPTEALIVRNNTFPKISQKILSFDHSGGWVRQLVPLTFSANVTKTGSYGITGDGSTAPGLPSLTPNAKVVQWDGNVIEATAERTIPLPTGTGNVLVLPGGLAALLDAAFKLRTGTAGY